MRIGIVTIISHNIGNRLQNYALQEFLKQYGTVETIPLIKKSKIERYVKIYIKKLLFLFGINKNYSWDELNAKIKWSRYICGVDDKKIENKYDFLVAGSDQIWNPLFNINSDREFLVSVSPSKRIAYAASIGIDVLPEHEEERFRRNLLNMKAISVRENSAATIVENLTYHRPVVVLDPTMLLDINKWKKILTKSRMKTENRYIVKYFLGNINQAYEMYINKVSKEMNAQIIEINSSFSNNSVNCGPSDFLKLIYNAVYIYTDSFHGTVFSILFKKNFLVFDRPNQEGYGKMSSRIETLLELTNLNDRMIREEADLYNEHNDINNYDEIDLILIKERTKAQTYLREALS